MTALAFDLPQCELPFPERERCFRLLRIWNRASTHYANRCRPHRLARACRLGRVTLAAFNAAGIPLPAPEGR